MMGSHGRCIAFLSLIFLVTLQIARVSFAVKGVSALFDSFFHDSKVSKKENRVQEATKDDIEQKHSCKYEDAQGSFTPSNGNFSWNWTSTSKFCPVVDYLGPVLRSHDTKLKIREPITFLFIGDSLDRNIVAFACNEGREKGFRVLPTYNQILQENGSMAINFSFTDKGAQELDHIALPINTAERERNAARLCTTGNITLAFFKIFGMNHYCLLAGWAAREDSRYQLFPSTDDRVRNLLPFEILSRIPKGSKVVVNAGSALWDLSEGCVDEENVDKSYEKKYTAGIRILHQVLTEIIPNATIYWRTSPPISQPYSLSREKLRRGRTRRNQAFLNDLLLRTVTAHQLGKVVDWWAQLAGVPEDILTDSMTEHQTHYTKEPSLAFFNMWLNAVFEYDKTLITASDANVHDT